MVVKHSNKLTVIDLFSGCGGLSYGLKKAGFEILLGVDNWNPSLKTFEHNHKNASVIAADISKLSKKEIYKKVSSKIDLVVGGPPCQGFSLSGPRSLHDKRNRLYLDFIRLVREIQPRVFIIENVPGLVSLFGGQVKKRIIEELSKIGYTVSSQILNASDYGVPQNRKRIFFVGIKGSKEFKFPSPTHFENKNETKIFNISKITVRDAISDLPLLDKELGNEEMDYSTKPLSQYQIIMRRGSSKIFNHIASKHTKKTIDIISLVPEGKNYKSLPNYLKSTRKFNIAWTRLHNDKLSPTIDTGHRHHFHPTAYRIPTVREAARIQSFPDTFKFLGTKTSQYKQVGNAVPPLLAAILGAEINKQI